jgi:hypothetical protein
MLNNTPKNAHQKKNTKEIAPNNLGKGDKNSTFSPILKAGSPL